MKSINIHEQTDLSNILGIPLPTQDFDEIKK